ncbi:hypothetical protein [Eisenbergiella sp.]
MNTKRSVYENTPEISVEDFLIYYYKAYQRGNVKAITQLHDTFPEVAELAFDEDYLNSLCDPADYEYQFLHPITIDSSRMTERRVLDMVAYLYGKHNAPTKYKLILSDKIPYQTIFNYQIERYQRDYNKTALWDCFFMELPELRYIVEQRRIKNLDELIYRASSYFEDHS